jgi:replication fork protection complex subunit Csm3/Swi3
MSDIEDLFDYDDGLDDVLKNLPSAQNKETSQAETNDNDADATKVLGLDADIKPTKQRAPIAKLDEARYDVLQLDNSLYANFILFK